MAELNNELDLTAPAAPTLTLDPIADEAAEAAKLEAPKAEPVKVEDTPLSPEEQKMVNDFAEKIDITNSQMVLQYGAASQKKAERLLRDRPLPRQDQGHGRDRRTHHQPDL